MQTQLHIRASCVISNQTIYKNQQPIYTDGSPADVNSFLVNAYRHFDLNYARFYKMDNLSKLGWLCCEFLVNDFGGTGEPSVSSLAQLPPEAVCVLVCNASSSLDTDKKYYETVSRMASPALFVYTLPNIVIGEMCIRNRWKGENMFFILDSFDAAFLQLQTELLMRSSQHEVCICGWVELMENDYKAALFLTSGRDGAQKPNFTPETIKGIFDLGTKPGFIAR